MFEFSSKEEPVSDTADHKSFHQRRIAETFEKISREQTAHGFLSLDALRDIILERGPELKRFGFEDIDIVASDSLHSYGGTLYAARVRATTKKSGEQIYGWVTMEIHPKNRQAEYRSSLGDLVIATTKIPEDFDMAWLQSQSESSKVVKSRPAFLYPELFHLPAEEVWPRGAKIAVVGDPYQGCDIEGVTMIDYEYADEMVPPVLRSVVSGNREPIKFSYWYRNLYHEDLNALERMYGGFAPSGENPYEKFLINAFVQCQEIFTSALDGSYDAQTASKKLRAFRELAQKLIDGSWTVEEVSAALGIEEQELREWHQYKQEAVEKKGNPKAWEEYVARWNKYLDELPIEYLREKIPNLDGAIKQARHWLEVLPTSKSSQRVEKGIGELQDIYNSFRVFSSDDDELAKKLYNPLIEEATSNGMMSDGAFGFFIPGFPVSLRVKKVLEEGILRLEQAVQYSQELYPRLVAERDRLQTQGIGLTEESLAGYLRELEQAWARQHFFRKRTQRAIPIHGFFPWKFSGIDPQDRILDLTGNTMHGWNTMSEHDFRKFFEASLPFVKVGGKYILGPINQHVYFHRQNETFDADGLTRVLQNLADEGTISYEFTKGQREYFDEFDGSNEDDESSWDQNAAVLHNDESAHSLVITRLK